VTLHALPGVSVRGELRGIGAGRGGRRTPLDGVEAAIEDVAAARAIDVGLCPRYYVW
jgi:hypothetical protein